MTLCSLTIIVIYYVYIGELNCRLIGYFNSFRITDLQFHDRVLAKMLSVLQWEFLYTVMDVTNLDMPALSRNAIETF